MLLYARAGCVCVCATAHSIMIAVGSRTSPPNMFICNVAAAREVFTFGGSPASIECAHVFVLAVGISIYISITTFCATNQITGSRASALCSSCFAHRYIMYVCVCVTKCVMCMCMNLLTSMSRVECVCVLLPLTRAQRVSHCVIAIYSWIYPATSPQTPPKLVAAARNAKLFNTHASKWYAYTRTVCGH